MSPFHESDSPTHPHTHSKIRSFSRSCAHPYLHRSIRPSIPSPMKSPIQTDIRACHSISSHRLHMAPPHPNHFVQFGSCRFISCYCNFNTTTIPRHVTLCQFISYTQPPLHFIQFQLFRCVGFVWRPDMYLYVYYVLRYLLHLR